MDSGISSAGNGGQAQASTAAANDHQKMLDQLLSDMLLTVENIPDLPASPKTQTTSVIDGIDDSLRALQVSKPGICYITSYLLKLKKKSIILRN